MDFLVFPCISIDLNTKTAEYRATRHEIKNFLYQAIDLFKPRRLKYARESETPKYRGKATKNVKPRCSGFSRNFAHLKEISISVFFSEFYKQFFNV